MCQLLIFVVFPASVEDLSWTHTQASDLATPLTQASGLVSRELLSRGERLYGPALRMAQGKLLLGSDILAAPENDGHYLPDHLFTNTSVGISARGQEVREIRLFVGLIEGSP